MGLKLCLFAPSPVQATSKPGCQWQNKALVARPPAPRVPIFILPVLHSSTDGFHPDQCKIAGCQQALQQLGNGKHSQYCSVAHQK